MPSAGASSEIPPDGADPLVPPGPPCSEPPREGPPQHILPRPQFPTRDDALHDLQQALAPGTNGNPGILHPFFLKPTVSRICNAGFGIAGWKAFLEAVRGPERCSYRFVRKLTEAFVQILHLQTYQEPELGFTERPVRMTPERWQRLGSILRRVAASAISFNWDHLTPFATGLAGLPLESLPQSTIDAICRAAPWALRSENTHSFFRSVETILENAPYFSALESSSALLLLSNRARSELQRNARLFSCFDALALRIPRLVSSRKISPDSIVDTIKKTAASAAAKNPPVLSKDAACVERICELIAHTCDYYATSGGAPLPAIHALVELLGDRHTSADSLGVLKDKIIPEYIVRRLPLVDAITGFAPIDTEMQAAEERDRTLDAAIASGAPLAPFIGSEYTRLLLDGAEGRLAARGYADAFLSPPNPPWNFLEDDGASWSVFEVASNLAMHGAEVWKSPGAIGAFLRDYCDIVDYLYRHHKATFASHISPFKAISDSAVFLVNLHGQYFGLHELASALHHSDPSQPVPVDPLVRTLQRTTFDAATLAFMNPPSDNVRDLAHHILRNEVRIDSLPFPNGYEANRLDRSTHDPRALRMHDEVVEIMWAGFDRSYGFGRRAFDARRPAPGETNMLVAFGLDSAKSVHCYNSSSNQDFPGAGCRISNFHLERLFAKDTSRPDDPYHLYKTAWDFARHELDDFARTSIVNLRGLVAVIPPDLEKYKIDGVHYSLVIFNDHFHNYSRDRAFLCPTVVLESKLEGTAIPASRFRGFDSKYLDLNFQPPSRAELELACTAAELPLLNLNWASNFGGLCNSFPPATGKYYSWEQGRNSGTTLVDKFGHLHKPARLGGYAPDPKDPRMEAAMVEFRELHAKVYSVSSRLYHLHYLFDVALAAYHRGETVTRAQVYESTVEQSDGFLERPAYEVEAEKAELAKLAELQLSEKSGDDNGFGFLEGPVNPHAYRMLTELYKWHKNAKAKGSPREECPIFSLQPALSHWPAPSPVTIDTYDLSLRMHGEVLQLPLDSDGSGHEEQEIWRNHVLPYFSSNRDPCIVPRSYAVERKIE
ncbi:MAG: hypothetical protein K1X79_04065 [Oligoflexia bacterium]|nr:hypothetical protein [Oligoflexia bacterium]